MGFHNVEFPEEVALGASGGPGFNTEIIQLDSGAEERVARWTAPGRRRYDIQFSNKTNDEIHEMLDFFMARNGALHSFLYKDWSDYTSASDGVSAPNVDDQQIGTGDGTTTIFQLQKVSLSGIYTQSRVIRKPIESSVRVEVDGVELTAGVDFTVDALTGEVTLATAPAAGLVVRAGFEFRVHVRFGQSTDDRLAISMRYQTIGSIDSIDLVEVIEDQETPCQFLYRGSRTINNPQSGVDYFLLENTGLVVNFTGPNFDTPVNAVLPLVIDVAPGGPHHIIVNSGGLPTAQVDIIDQDTLATITSVPQNESAEVHLMTDELGNKRWLVLALGPHTIGPVA